MTSETPNLHVSKNEKLKAPVRLVWECCSVVFKIGSKIFLLQWHFKLRGDLEIIDIDFAETLFIEIRKPRGKNIIVDVIYRPPDRNLDYSNRPYA